MNSAEIFVRLPPGSYAIKDANDRPVGVVVFDEGLVPGVYTVTLTLPVQPEPPYMVPRAEDQP